MSEIKLSSSDWLYNSGLVGFINILEHANQSVRYVEQDVYVDEKSLENFSDKYFKYLIDTYNKNISWYKIISFEEFIDKHREEDFENFGLKELEILNNYIGSNSKSGTMKSLLNSNSYKAAYNLISIEEELLSLSDSISTIKLKKGESIESKLEEIKKTFAVINKIIKYCKDNEAKRYIGAKNVMYTFIKNAWNGVSFLNPQTKVPDMYLDYDKYFGNEAIEFLKTDSSKYKHQCTNCNSKTKDMHSDLSFLNNVGFDTARKPSHVWNFNNDIAVCPICKLVYSCMPAGFLYVYNNGIFINQNQNIKDMVKVNYAIKHEILENEESNNVFNAFKIMINQFDKKSNESFKYEFADVQVVRYENINDKENYRFNLLSKNILKVLVTSKDWRDSLIKKGFKENNIYINIYDEVLKKLLNNENLFLLIHKLIVQKLSKPSESQYNMSHVMALIKTNNIYLEGVGNMEKRDNDVLISAKNAGYYFRKAYIDKGSDNKINGISYKLLNALKTNNLHMFMDTLINCYLYTKNSVPKFFVESMKDEYEFKGVGYAFIAGITSEEYKNKSNGGGI